KRLGRKSDGGDLFEGAAADVPVAFIIFDLLWLDRRSLLKTPLRERRERLGRLQLPRQVQRAEIVPAHSAAEIEQVFQQARRRLNAGLMIKDPERFYSPGGRGTFWFKLKKALATLAARKWTCPAIPPDQSDSARQKCRFPRHARLRAATRRATCKYAGRC